MTWPEAVGGEALAAPMDVHLADHTVAQPDVLYVSPERQEILQTWIEGAPDLVVEVLSPSTARMDRLLKLNRYAEAGVREYWLDGVSDQQRRAPSMRWMAEPGRPQRCPVSSWTSTPFGPRWSASSGL